MAFFSDSLPLPPPQPLCNIGMFVNGNPPSTSCPAAFYLDSAACKALTISGHRRALLASPYATWDANGASTTLVLAIDAGGVPGIVSHTFMLVCSV